MANTSRKHKLEIQIYEANWENVPDGAKPNWQPVMQDARLSGGRMPMIEVADKKELEEFRKQYALCDQRFEIVREIDPFPWDESASKKSKDNEASTAQNVDSVKTEVDSILKTEPAKSADKDVAKENIKFKPKIVTIGDMQVKYDGDKVYQKQWVKLNATEAMNYRIVNDSNNKIVNLNGKHIEARKWVIVEDISEEQEEDL